MAHELDITNGVTSFAARTDACTGWGKPSATA